MDPKSDSRTAKPLGETISRLRTERGWRVKNLVRKAGCAERTVAKAERGGSVYLVTLSDIGGALGIAVRDLLPGALSPPPAEKPFRLEIAIEGDLKMPSGSKSIVRLIEVLSALISEEDGPSIAGIRGGGVIVTLDMSETAALRLVALFPHFRERAREDVLRTPAGQAHDAGEHSEDVQELLDLVDAVTELRIAANGAESRFVMNRPAGPRSNFGKDIEVVIDVADIGKGVYKKKLREMGIADSDAGDAATG